MDGYLLYILHIEQDKGEPCKKNSTNKSTFPLVRTTHLQAARPPSHRVREACNLLGEKNRKECLRRISTACTGDLKRNGSKSLKQKSKVEGNAKRLTTLGTKSTWLCLHHEMPLTFVSKHT